MTAQDDLAPLLMARPQQALRFGQGELVHWDADAFTNRVRFRGVELTNLPVLSGAEALTFRSGDVVSLVGWGASWAILGRIVSPTAANAARTVQFLQNNLARQIAAEVFGQGILAATINTAETTSSTTYTDLTTAGPAVTASISPSGRALVFVATEILTPTEFNAVGSASFAVSGATTVAASGDRAVALGKSTVDQSDSFSMAASTAVLVTGLNAGSNTFTMKYRSVFGNSIEFSERTIVVIPF